MHEAKKDAQGKRGNEADMRRTDLISIASKKTTTTTNNYSPATLALTLAVAIVALIAALLAFPQSAHASLQSDYDDAVATYDAIAAEKDATQAIIDGLSALASEQKELIATLPDAPSELVDETRITSDINHLGHVKIFGKLAQPIAIDATLPVSEALAKFKDELAQAKPRIHSEKAFAQCELAGVEALLGTYEYQMAKIDAELATADANKAAAKKKLDDYKATHGTYSGFSGSVTDEASARAFIIMKESGGNYQATNGRYYGAYQLDRSYLNGDFSPANQDATAERYVKGRYGSWMAAYRFWVGHNWY